MDLPELNREQARRLASLLAIGRQSGDTVVGLSGVRRSGPLAYLFVDRGISAGTLSELGRLAAQGVRVYRVESLAALTWAFGREDLLVVGVRCGALAQGVADRLAGL